MAKEKKRNWDQLKGRDIQDTVKYRDVYEDQQLERSRIQEKQSMKSRQIIMGILAALIAIVVYFFVSVFQYATSSFNLQPPSVDIPPYYMTEDIEGYHADIDGDGRPDRTDRNAWVDPYTAYYSIDEAGNRIDDIEYKSLEEVPVPDWYTEKKTALEQDEEYQKAWAEYYAAKELNYYLRPSFSKLFWSFAAGLLFFAAVYPFMIRNLEAQNLMNDTADINQYQNDQHIALPEEVQQKFDWFPDVGAHCNVQVSSMISHVALSNKGLKKIPVSQRATEQIFDDDGDVVYEKGQVLLDDDGNVITKQMPMIDEKFMDALFEASGMPDDKRIRKYYDATQIPYNPDGKDRTKQGGKHKTVADMINAGWTFPEYEPQRPAGAYLVDTEPVNTMVLAITRAGKGQTVIEPTLDMWTRELRPNNMVINDPKGELLVKFYVRGTIRGFQIVQFNLINAMKTDIYNRASCSVVKSCSRADVA